MKNYPLSPEMQALKERYQKHGYLLKGKGRNWEKDFSTKKHIRMFGVNLASHGGWDFLKANGWVTTPVAAVMKAVFLLPEEDVLLSCWNIVIGPLFIQYAKMPKPCN